MRRTEGARSYQVFVVRTNGAFVTYSCRSMFNLSEDTPQTELGLFGQPRLRLSQISGSLKPFLEKIT